MAIDRGMDNGNDTRELEQQQQDQQDIIKEVKRILKENKEQYNQMINSSIQFPQALVAIILAESHFQLCVYWEEQFNMDAPEG